MSRRFASLPFLLFAIASAPVQFRAQAPEELATERILNFHSDITVNPDGSMDVRETIKVRAEGEQIKRGIYRDFPTRYKDRLNNQYVVGFELREALRDGKPEPHHTESLSNGIRIYFGEKSVFLNPGEYTYTLGYKTTRQLGFFQDHDELYWNVTGNGWAFPIDEASATVTLPRGVHRDAVLLDGYTGPQGSLGKAFKWSVDGESRADFRTTKPLDPEEGLTIVVSWPKGFIAEPTRDMKIQWFLEDNLNVIVASLGLLVIFLYYVVAWFLVGRDPAGGVIMPLYEPPQGFSPAAVRYLSEMGFDHRIFAAAVINMAVKKFLTIHDKEGVYTLTKGQGQKTLLSPEEASAADKLFSNSDKVELQNTNHARIGGALEALKTSLRLSMEKIYFFTNRRYLIPGLVMSVLVLIVAGLSAPGEQKFTALFMTVWLGGWSVGVFFLGSQVIQAWRGVWAGGGHRASALAGAVFITLFATPFFIGEIVGLVILGYAASITVLAILLIVAVVNYLFHYLLKAPTHAGRTLLDKIEGFKMFLAAAEKDRLNMLNPPLRTPQLFEMYLPYALALGVEQQWSEQFADVLAQASARGTTYSPSWYSGTSWSTLGATGFASSLGSSFSSAISSSSTAPGSRSGGGGGGGSSGGGGGGGGGGGW
jgi:uncharacterized membrane protein YgcG